MRARDLAILVFALAGYVIGLAYIPWAFPPDPALPNVAARLGYNISLAHLTIVAWSIAVFVIVFLLPADRAGSPEGPPRPSPDAWPRKAVELLLVLAAVTLLYWPAARARFAGGFEDDYFIYSLFRRVCGDLPYMDFEFLYGPLMFAGAWKWTEIFGLSRVSYYSYYLLLQLIACGAVVLMLQKWLPRQGQRLAAYAVVAPFMVDFLGGLNWMPMRYLAPFFLILILSGGPVSLARGAMAGILLGVQLTYSYEYGIAAAVAAVTLLSASLLAQMSGRNLWRHVRVLVSLAGVTLGVWLMLASWATEGNIAGLILQTQTVARASLSKGLGQFAYFWTVHNLSLFTLLAIGVAAIAAGARQIGTRPASRGDLMWIGAVAYAIVALKIGLQRADFLHLAVPFLPIILVALSRERTAVLSMLDRARPIVTVALVFAALAHAYGLIPNGRWAVLGTARGWYHELTGRETLPEIPSRVANTQGGRFEPRQGTIELAARLMQPDFADRDVIFYASKWDIAPEVGVCPKGFVFYEVVYADEILPLSETANEPATLVVISQADYDALQSQQRTASIPDFDTLTKLAGWISSRHAFQSAMEEGIELEIWREVVGDQLLATFSAADRVGDNVILEAAK